MVPSWFLPALSREESEAKLLSQNPGNFLIRQSSHTGSLALSVNTGKSGENGVQHFIINSRDGCVALEDSDLEFDSLVSLVNYYTSNREELPVALKLHIHERKISAPVGMRRGDSPYVSMVGKQRTKSTIWINSPAFRSSDDESSTLEKDLEVIKTVLQQNSVLDLDLQNLENEQAKTKVVKNNNEVKVITQSEPIDTSWKDASKSWLDSSKFWLDACKPVGSADAHNNEPDTTSVEDTWQERLEKDGGKSTVVVNEVPENEYEDYSLPIDIQNTSNIYEDPDIVRSNMVHAKPSTKAVSDDFNANKNKVEGPLSLPNSDRSMTKNKISLPVCSPTNISAPKTPATKQIPSFVTTPPAYAAYVSSPPSFVTTPSTRQPLEPFQPIRKLSYNHNHFNRHERLARSPYGIPGLPGQPGKLESGTRSAEYRPRFRKNNSVMCPPPFRSLDNNKMASTNLSKSCSDLLKEIEKKNGPPIQQNELRKSFVRKVSLNLSVRKSNSKPIRKISDAMNKIFSMPKISVKSLLNSQVNSDSWEYLAECGVNPVYEEVQEHKAKDSEDNNKNINKAVLRCMSVDSLYESETSNSNSSSMSRENTESPSLKKSSSEQRLKSSSSGENRNKGNPTKPNISQRAKSKNVGTVADKILFV